MQILKRERYRFLNKNCSANSTCNLKYIDYFIEDYRIEVEGSFSYGTRMYAGYGTDKVESLDKYVFVQFIKGCVFTSKLIEGVVFNYLDFGRYSYSEPDGIAIFIHPNWEVDSTDSDPVYNSTPETPRHFYYRWNTEPGSFS